MKKEILIYDKGELIGVAPQSEDYPEDGNIMIHDSILNDMNMKILHISGMDYAIVIPDDIAIKVRDIFKKVIDDVDNNKMEDRNEK